MAGPFKKPAAGAPDFLRERTRLVSKKLQAEFAAQLQVRQNNFDSGVPLEDAFRHELAQLLDPYGVDVGLVVDREGYTSGECDVVILDRRLAPLLVAPAAPISRTKWFAFEATYGIVEVKQSLTLGALDKDGALLADPKGSLYDACTKVFAYKQLVRSLDTPLKWGSNAPLGYIFCYSYASPTDSSESRDAILREFVRINSEVPPAVRVNGLYVLDQFSVTWSFRWDPSSHTFLTLQHAAESPRQLWASFQPTGTDTLYKFFCQLWSVLARTQLSGPDLASHYGGRSLEGQDIHSMPAPIDATRPLKSD